MRFPIEKSVTSKAARLQEIVRETEGVSDVTILTLSTDIIHDQPDVVWLIWQTDDDGKNREELRICESYMAAVEHVSASFNCVKMRSARLFGARTRDKEDKLIMLGITPFVLTKEFHDPILHGTDEGIS
jgi:hypothetical protein